MQIAALEIRFQDLRDLFALKYGDVDKIGWAPRRRLAFGYFHPAEYYEALVQKLAVGDIEWIDIGCGRSLFPSNEPLAHALSQRVRRLVGVDPSENVEANPYVHESVRCPLERYTTDTRFDLATLRMVAEHVADPAALVQVLSRLVKPGGLVVVFTPYLWSPSSVVSRILPFKLHDPIVKWLWGSESEDVFPTVYRMNTRNQLAERFNAAGFEEIYFRYLDDLSLFARFRLLNYVELILWRLSRTLRIRYPESCLLGVYQRSAA